MKRPFLLYLLCIPHIFLGTGAIAGGGMLLIKPDGSLMGMDPEWLDRSPFHSYLVPGIILFTLVGLLPLVTLVGLLGKSEWRWMKMLNIYPNMHWAWATSLYSGIIVILWIAIQQVMTQYFWLQPVMIFTGILIIVFTLSPAVMKYFVVASNE